MEVSDTTRKRVKQQFLPCLYLWITQRVSKQNADDQTTPKISDLMGLQWCPGDLCLFVCLFVNKYF